MNTKCTKWSQNIPNVLKIFQMAINYIHFFQSKALENLPKLEFLVRKKTIWQSCPGVLGVLRWNADFKNVYADVNVNFLTPSFYIIDPD
jgi:hypothetical protein